MNNSGLIPKLMIGDLEARVPIIQGGMGVGISLSGLASSVANTGAIGVIAAAGIGVLEPDYVTNFMEANKRSLRNQIRTAREQTDGIIGVNIMLALSDYEDLSIVALEEEADIIFWGAGLPLRLPRGFSKDRLQSVHTRIVPIVSSGKAAKIIFRSWAKRYNHIPDAIVVEGPMAGGHLGFSKEQIKDPNFQLEKILPDVISAIEPFEQQFGRSIPVVAAGGIYTGEDVYKYISMGAGGVQMATRFVATHECDADEKFKEIYVNCKKEDSVIIDSPVGLPGSAIVNKFLEDVSEGIKKPFSCIWKCLNTCDFRKVPYCIATALDNARKGLFEEGFAFAGANAYRINKIVTVKELISSLVDEYESVATKTMSSLRIPKLEFSKQ